MRVFVTGATGFVGSHLVRELLQVGHEVLGLTRSDDGVRKLEEAGAQAYRGSLDDLAGLTRGAGQADAVIHTAFEHDFTKFVENCEKDRHVVTALADALVGSDRPLLISSVTNLGSPGHDVEVAAEERMAYEHVLNDHHPIARIATEQAGTAALDRGVSVAVVRMPQIHDTTKQGLITPLIDVARDKGFSAYVRDGQGRWPAGHVTDVARLCRLALDKHETGARYNAVAENVTARSIAEVIGAGLGVPVKSIPTEQMEEHFGWISIFIDHDIPASSAWTRERLGWEPTGPSLVDDLKAINYQAAVPA